MQNLIKLWREIDTFTETLQISQTPAQQSSRQVLAIGGNKRRLEGRKRTSFLFLPVFVNPLQAGEVHPGDGRLLPPPASSTTTEPTSLVLPSQRYQQQPGSATFPEIQVLIPGGLLLQAPRFWQPQPFPFFPLDVEVVSSSFGLPHCSFFFQPSNSYVTNCLC